MKLTTRTISRRSLLRSSVLGSAGLAGAYILGCSDGDGAGNGPLPTLTAGPTSTPVPGSMRWDQLTPAGPQPPPRSHHSLVSDGSRLLLFGGQGNDADLSDLWEYDIATGAWTEQALAGPAPRHGHNAIWDAVNNRMLVFGGQQRSSFFNDLWQYDPAEDRWAELAPAGPVPAARYGAASAYSPSVPEDAIRPFLPQRFIITHGFTAGGRFDDTWALDLTTDTWADVSPEGERPIERCLMPGFWDTLRNRLVMFGGQTTGTPFLDDLWTLSSGRGWTTVLREPRPAGRTFYSFAFDEGRARAIMFGGNTEDGARNDVWLFHVQDEFWTLEQPDGERPSSRSGHDAVWVDAASTMFVFGGSDGNADLNELWELSVAV